MLLQNKTKQKKIETDHQQKTDKKPEKRSKCGRGESELRNAWEKEASRKVETENVNYTCRHTQTHIYIFIRIRERKKKQKTKTKMTKERSSV